MLALAETLRPAQVTLVPERREEVTTEGGSTWSGTKRPCVPP
jgi:pyridoxine 5'-phosphate synthase PdxJ